MPEDVEIPNTFKELKWSDLQNWAGGKATVKGVKYQEEGRVKEIKCTSAGSLVALVEGTTEYFTEVYLEKGKLSSICTCPVGHDCKHGVAVVLEYLDHIDQEEQIPVITEEDLLIERSRRGYAGAEIPEAYGTEESSRVLREYLEQLEKAKLIEILTTFAKKDDKLGRYLRDRKSLASEDPEKIIRRIYSQLDELWREMENFDFWEDKDVPDFTDVQIRLESLLDSGHAGELLEIGKELMDRYQEFAEYDEDGRIGTEISSCMDVVFRALPQFSLPEHKKMLYILDIELKDNYSILNEHTFWKEEFTQEEWRLFAETLKTRLQKAGKVKDILHDSSWERDYVVDRLIDALRKTGLSEEIIPISEREAERTGNYLRLIRELLDSGQKAKAEEWIYRGIKAMRENRPETARELLQILVGIKEEEGDWLSVTAIETEEFFRAPQLASYIEMQKAAERIDKWQEIREAALEYLRKGELPVKKARIEEKSILPGILPKTGLLEIDSLRKVKPPVLDLLIQIAIQENNADETVQWYEELKRSKGGGEKYLDSVPEDRIADTIKGKYPETAIEIWKKLAEDLIAETKVSSYEVAYIHLRKIKETMGSIGKKEEWEAYLREIREVNRRKRRLLEILDMLEEDRIIVR